MIQVRNADDRGLAEHGWLTSRHSFSFGDYHDPAHMGFGNLRVLNDDRVQPGQGFGTHGHRDMEIISVVLDGVLAHRDSLGGDEVGQQGELRPGDVQCMSAGAGIRHSEFNASATDPVHFLQVWILPALTGVVPSYAQARFDPADQRGRLRLVASREGAESSLRMNADARLSLGRFDGDAPLELPLNAERLGYVHVAQGEVTVNGVTLHGGDALRLQGESQLRIERGERALVLVFDLAA